MDLQDLKRWHWMLIGLLVGSLWAATRLFYGINVDNDDPENQGVVFEKIVMSTKDNPAFVDFLDNGNMYVADLVVHPVMPDNSPDASATTQPGADQIQWVTGTVARRRFKRDSRDWQTRAFRYKAAVPFVPRKGANYVVDDWVPYGRFKPVAGYVKPNAKSYPSITDYFNELNRKFGGGSVHYRYAWWEARWVIMTMYPLGGLVLIGGVWPTVLGLLVGAGFGGKRKTEDYDLTRFKGTSTSPINKPRVITDADHEQLADLEAELEKNLAATAKPAAPTTALPPEPTIKTLNATSLETTPHPTAKPTPQKSFGTDGGAYYPTEIHSKPKE